jgi:hypothetical protein
MRSREIVAAGIVWAYNQRGRSKPMPEEAFTWEKPDQKAHALMDKLKISHDYRDGPARKHEWGSGWVPEAVRLLMGAG